MADQKPERRLEAQPDHIDMGVNYVGAKLEGSFQILGVSECKSLGWSFDITSDAPGEHKILLHAECAEGTASIDIKIELRAGTPSSDDLAICDSPFDLHTSASTIRELRRFLDGFNARLHYLESPRELLSMKLRSLLLHGTGLIAAAEDCPDLAQSLTSRGVNVIVMADEFYRGTTDAANRLLAPFALSFKQDGTGEPGISGEERMQRILAWQGRYSLAISRARDIRKHSLTSGVGRLYWHRPCPIQWDDRTAEALALNSEDHAEAFLVAAKPGGYVVAVGTSLWSSFATTGWPYDNDRLLANLLAGGDAETADICGDVGTQSNK